MKLSTYIVAATLTAVIAPANAAVTLVEGASFDASKTIKADWGDRWTFDSQTFKVKDNSNIFFSFDFTPAKKNTGSIYGLLVDLLEGNRIVSSESFSGNDGEFTFTNNFAANKNYKFRFNGFSSNFKGKINYEVAAIAPVPEPETYALMGLGLVGIFAARRRKMQA